jgi:hypothetical protein
MIKVFGLIGILWYVMLLFLINLTLTRKMITWAALLVLQGVEGGTGEQDGMLLS